MPRKPPPTIGHCPCPQCDEAAEIRRGKAGIYGLCKSCGKFSGQEYILNNGQIYGAADPVPAGRQTPPPPPVPPAPPAPGTGSGVAPVRIAGTRTAPADDEGDAHKQIDFVQQKQEQGARGAFWPWG